MNEKIKNHWDQIVLIVASVVAIGCSGYFIFRSLTFAKEFEAADVPPVVKLKETGLTDLETAAGLYRGEVAWAKPEGAWGLFRSVPIVLDAQGEARRVEAEGTPVLPPLSNAYILKHGLDITSPDLLRQDPDGDGFTNEEEFINGETDPNNRADHPPFYTKLCLVELMPSDYTLIYETTTGNQHQIKRIRKTASGDETDNFWMREGESFDDGDRFRLDRYEKVEGVNPRTDTKVDLSVVTVTDMATGANQTFELERAKPFPLPTFTGIFRDALDTDRGDFKIKEGDSIILSKDTDSIPYKVIKVTEDEAEIENPEGESIIVPRCGAFP
ncbi:MAG TPA: Amuc_1099 family pilus-like system protein [Verrucomicrobiales bacterium]|nr:Amuc_1099 family pilus-like system protein [Verrucomicrobiales bacterium]